MNCIDCPLKGGCKVHSSGPKTAMILGVGDVNRWWEGKSGYPFAGDGGRELDGYLRRSGLTRQNMRLTNLVKCVCKGDLPVKAIDHCSEHVLSEILEIQPPIIMAMGSNAVKWFLGEDVSMEYVHGIPYRVNTIQDIDLGFDVVVVPCYHPTDGMGMTSLMTLIEQDYSMVGSVLRQESDIIYRTWPPTPDNVLAISTKDQGLPRPEDITHVAIDTETMEDGVVICTTYTFDGEIAFRTDSDEFLELRRLNSIVGDSHITTIMHNALFDLPKLHSIGVYPANYTDTMSMAYLLQDLPKGLKPLAYRLLNFTMRKYKDVIGPYTQLRALDFLDQALQHDYPNPDPVMSIDGKGEVKLKQPQNVKKLLTRVFNDYCKDDSIDVFNRIRGFDDYPTLESTIGPLREADIRDVDYYKATDYACADAIATYQIYHILWPRIVENSLQETLSRDMGIIPSVVEMQSTGFYADRDYLLTLTDKFTEELDAVANSIYALTGQTINLNSPSQMANMLYKCKVFSSPGQSTASDDLDLYRVKHPDIINAISRYRELSTLIKTFTKPLPDRINSDNRITTSLSITGTTTGRLSSSKPNLMNIPSRTAEGKSIRNGFIATPGCVLMSNDYSQIEMRMAAHMSMDPKMMQIFETGVDIHSQTAAWMFNIPIDKVDKNKHRKPAKAVGFGILYGISSIGLAKQFVAEGLTITEEECQDSINRWFAVFEDVYRFMESVKCDARRYQRTWDMFGRYRLIPETLSVVDRIRSAGLRQAGNNPVQSGAQGIIKEAMARLYPEIVDLRQGGRYIARFIIQIHDDLVFEVSEDIKGEAMDRIKSTMESAVELVVPTPVDSKWAYKWGEL